MHDYLDPRNMEGFPKKADALFALDFLLTVKMGIRTAAFAISEVATPEARATLRKQLEESIALHGEFTQLSLRKGWLHAYDLDKQYDLDLVSAKDVSQIAQMDLFPEDTSRQGMFATPNL